jgi:hypothetical protein
MKMQMKFSAALAGAALVAGGLFQSAQADMVEVGADSSYQDVGFISGVDRSSNAFDIVLAGTYRATLTDFVFPEAFQALQLIVTSATQEFGRIEGTGSFVFDADPGRYFVSLFGQAGGIFDLGLYGVDISVANVAPVPLPPAALLLLSALGALAAVRKRREGEHADGEKAAA